MSSLTSIIALRISIHCPARPFATAAATASRHARTVSAIDAGTAVSVTPGANAPIRAWMAAMAMLSRTKSSSVNAASRSGSSRSASASATLAGSPRAASSAGRSPSIAARASL